MALGINGKRQRLRHNHTGSGVNSFRPTFVVLNLFLLLFASAILAGCSNDSANKPANKPNASQKGANLSAGQAGMSTANASAALFNALLNGQKPGKLIAMAMAQEILASGRQPFKIKLPQLPDLNGPPVSLQGPTGGPIAPPPMADPLESLLLSGIVYNPNKPMALFQLSGANQTEPVGVGSVLHLDGGDVKVTRITPSTVQVVQVGGAKTKRTFEMPSIVGYSPSASGGAKGVAAAGLLPDETTLATQASGASALSSPSSPPEITLPPGVTPPPGVKLPTHASTQAGGKKSGSARSGAMNQLQLDENSIPFTSDRLMPDRLSSGKPKGF